MKETHLYYVPGLPSDTTLPEDEAHHAVRVLRVKEGDALLATDGRGAFYDCKVAEASPKRCIVKVEKSYVAPQLWRGRIKLAVAPTKNMDRMEWLAEKATEIGLDGISFVDCRNSERRVIKTERIEKIVISAVKQSHKGWKPDVQDMCKFKDFISQPHTGQRFIAHCLAENLPLLTQQLSASDDAVILIGPEGDFTPEEVKLAESAGFVSVSLGKSRLRTETAALVSVHLMNLAKSEQ